MFLYEKYHLNRKLEKRVINDTDYTHRPLLSMLDIKYFKDKKVLDIGCGTGTICLYLASKGSSVLGVDISRNAIKLANINSRNLGLVDKVKFLLADFTKMQINGKYELIVCSELLEHVKDHKAVLGKIYKLLKKNGHVIFSVPLDSSFLYRYKFLDKFDEEAGHLRRYNQAEFIQLIKNTKFNIVDVKKNQGVLRDYLFTSTTESKIVALANRFKFFSDLLTSVDKWLFFLEYRTWLL
jgi:2-polyprenyl-3-methyl-5-hydroxy-6-metoxy-1,4-benzoquinol methylase